MAEEKKLSDEDMSLNAMTITELSSDEDDDFQNTPYSDISSNAMTIGELYAMYKDERACRIRLQQLAFTMQQTVEEAIQDKQYAERRLQQAIDGQLNAIRLLHKTKTEHQYWVKKKMEYLEGYHKRLADYAEARIQIAACPNHGIYGRNIYDTGNGQANYNYDDTDDDDCIENDE